MNRSIPFLLLLALLLAPGMVTACFGPKLYLAAQAGAQGDVLYQLVALYLKEKTGIETVRADLQGEPPLAALRAERADLAFAAAAGDTPVMAIEGLPLLSAGARPVEDLQFTTVLPALRKLGGLLTAQQVAALVADVERGASPAAAARRLLTEKRWI